LFEPSLPPEAQPLFVIQYGGELENASRMAVGARSTIRCRIARWFASAVQSQAPSAAWKPGVVQPPSSIV